MRNRYGVEPAQVPDFIALRGDASDKIPGATGVGPRTYRSIATMNKSAPLPSLKAAPTWGKASELARQWELNRLGDRLAGLAKASAEN